MDLKKHLNYLSWLLIVIFGLMCLARAGVHAVRIVKEIRTAPEPYYAQIRDCSFVPQTEEEMIIWKYKTLELQCKK